MTYTITKKLLALLLVLTMCFSLLPLPAFAEGPEDEEEQIEELQEFEDVEPPEEGDDGGDGEACEHEPAEAVRENELAPSCTEPGSHDEVVYCSLCGEELSRETVEDPALGHTPEEVEAVASTCTEYGHAVGKVCAVCGDVLEGCEELPLAAHTPEDVEEIPAEVGKPGTTAGVVCSLCGEILEGCEEIPALEWDAHETSITFNTQMEGEGDDYPYKDSTPDVAEEWGFLTRECTSFVAWCLNSRNGVSFHNRYIPGTDERLPSGINEDSWGSRWGHAYEWENAANALGYNVDNRPATGAVALWRKRGDWDTTGHVAWVKSVNDDGTIDIEQYTGFDTFVFKAETVSVSSPSCYLHIKDLSSSPTPPAPVNPSGTCGANLRWELDGNGVLTISGTGNMTDWESASVVAWNSYIEQIKTVVIENGAESIGDFAFSGCSVLTSVTIPGSVTTIGRCAFSSCTGLTKIVIPEGVTTIEGGAFYWCKGLTNVTMPASLTICGEYSSTGVFEECTALNAVYISNLAAWCWIGFPSKADNPLMFAHRLYLNGKLITALTIPNGLTEIRSFVFCGGGMTSVTIPASVTHIFTGAFADCPALTSVKIQGESIFIGSDAFSNCGKLKTATFGAGSADGARQTVIGEHAFASCEKLTGIVLPEGLTTIGDYAFLCCRNMTSVTIPASLTSVGDGAFEGCEKLNAVKISDLTAWCGISFSNPWGHPLMNAGKLYLNGELITALLIPEGVTQIKNYAFLGCSALTSVMIPEGVTSIGDSAFINCSGMKSVTVPLSMQSIGSYAFYGCSALTDVYYGGMERHWNAMAIEEGNEPLTDARLRPSIVVDGECFPDPIFRSYVFENFDLDKDGFLREDERNAVKVINVSNSGIITLQGIEFFTALSSLYCDGNSLSTLDVSGCTALTYLSCESNGLSALNVNGCTVLKTMFCGNNSLTALDMSGCTALGELYCYNNSLQTLNISGCEKLLHFYCDNNSLTDVDISGSPYLVELTQSIAPILSGTVLLYINDNSALRCDLDTELILTPFPESFTLDREYLLLGQGQTAQLAAVGLDPQWAGKLMWMVSSDGKPRITVPIHIVFSDFPPEPFLEPDGAYEAFSSGRSESEEVSAQTENSGSSALPISVSADGTVTALNKGTAYVVAYIKRGGQLVFASCRVDVVEGAAANAVIGMRLLYSRAATELYSADYTRINVIPVLEQNQNQASADAFTVVDDLPEDDSWEADCDSRTAITYAKFADGETNDRFLLHVVDDHTLEIIPRAEYVTTDAATLKNLKSSYTSAILVTVAGCEEPFETAPLTLTVKKSTPKVTVKVDKLNSFIPGDTKPLIFTGTPAVKTWIDDSDPKKPVPDWLTYDEEAFTVTLNANALDLSKSGKLYLLVQPEGWNVKLPVTVSVSAAKSAPKLTLKPNSLSLHPGVNDYAHAAVTVTPAGFDDPEVWTLAVVSVLEGKNDASGALGLNVIGNEITARKGAKPPMDDKAHTYKATLALMRRDGDGGFAETPVQTALTVKLLASGTAISLSAKAAGFIDTGIPESPITLTVTPKNVNPGAVRITGVTVSRQKKGEAAEDVSERFDTSIDGLNVTLRQSTDEVIEAGWTYSAVVITNVGQTAPVNLTMKFSDPAKVRPSVTLKAAGFIDVIRPGSSITITPTIKNHYGHLLSKHDLVFYSINGKQTDILGYGDDTQLPFAVFVENDSFVVTRSKPVNHLTEKYAVGMAFDGLEAKPVNLTLTMGSANITQSVKIVTMLADDCYDWATVKLTPAAELSEIDRVVLDSPKDKLKRDVFALTDLGNGEYAIVYNERLLPAGFTGGTAKLNVFLKGNLSDKPNATLSVSVKLG